MQIIPYTPNWVQPYALTASGLGGYLAEDQRLAAAEAKRAEFEGRMGQSQARLQQQAHLEALRQQERETAAATKYAQDQVLIRQREDAQFQYQKKLMDFQMRQKDQELAQGMAALEAIRTSPKIADKDKPAWEAATRKHFGLPDDTAEPMVSVDESGKPVYIDKRTRRPMTTPEGEVLRPLPPKPPAEPKAPDPLKVQAYVLNIMKDEFGYQGPKYEWDFDQPKFGQRIVSTMMAHPDWLKDLLIIADQLITDAPTKQAVLGAAQQIAQRSGKDGANVVNDIPIPWESFQ